MNILIIKLGALGDVVMATPLIDAILKFHPDDDVHLLTSPGFAPIFEAWPRLEVTAHPRRGFGNTCRSLRFIRALHCARIYDLQGNDRSGLLVALSGAPIRVGNHNRFPYTHHPVDRWQGQQHIFERMLDVLGSAGIHEVAERPVLPIDAHESAAVSTWMERHALGDRNFALLHAGASAARPEKCWPYFAEFGRRLEHHGVRAVWIGAGADRAINGALLAQAGGIDASDAFGIAALAELGRHARFAVTNDSGPMHVLAAAGIPVFGLFGPSDWRRNHALGQREHVIACVECCPEHRGERTAACLDRVSIDLVWQRLSAAALV